MEGGIDFQEVPRQHKWRDKIGDAYFSHRQALQSLLENSIPVIERICVCLIECLKEGHQVLICGNGGSAADAQHLAAELVGRFQRERKAYPVLALTTNTSILTAIGNDYSYDMVFSRQVEAFGRAKDVLVAISTSGNSENVYQAAKAAGALGMRVVAMTGEGGGKLKEVADILLEVPSSSTPRIQEMHILVGHIICELVEDALC